MLGCLATASAPADPGPKAQQDLVEAGRRDYLEHCATCHGQAAGGDGPTARALRIDPADLTHIAARRGGEFPRLEIAYVIDGRFEIQAHGSRSMPIWGTAFRRGLPDDETGESLVRGRIAALVEYLVSIQEAGH